MSATEEQIAFLVDGARYGDMEDVEIALKEKIPVDSKDWAGKTALHMASANCHVDIIQRLIAAGANVDVKNAEGNTPMHWACLNGHVEAVKILMEAGASATILNNAGRTPFDEAMDQGHEAVLEIIRAHTGGSGVTQEGDELVVEVPDMEEEGEEEGEDEPMDEADKN